MSGASYAVACEADGDDIFDSVTIDGSKLVVAVNNVGHSHYGSSQKTDKHKYTGCTVTATVGGEFESREFRVSVHPQDRQPVLLGPLTVEETSNRHDPRVVAAGHQFFQGEHRGRRRQCR